MLAKRANSYISVNFMVTGFVEVKYQVGKKMEQELLTDNNSVTIIPTKKVDDILATLEGLSDQERWFLLRALEQYPQQDPVPAPGLYEDPDFPEHLPSQP